MGKSSKKSTPKVDAAPAVVVPAKSAKKGGKREAEEAIEKQASAKKQKIDAIEKQKSEVKTQKKINKKEESSSEETSSSESEEEQKVIKVAVKKGGVPPKESSSEDESSSDDEPAAKPVASRNGAASAPANKGKLPSSSDSSDSESDSEEDEKNSVKLASQPKKIPATATKNAVAPKTIDESSDSSDEESSSDDEDENEKKPAPLKKPTPATKNAPVVASKKKETEASDSSDEEDESDEDEEETVAAPKKKVETVSAPTKKVESSESSSDDESDDEEDEAPAAKVVPLKRPASAAGMKAPEAEDEDDSEDSDESDSDDEEPQKKKVKTPPGIVAKKTESDDSTSGEETTDEEDEQPSKTPKKIAKDADVEMEDAAQQKSAFGKKAPQTPATPQAQTGGKTLFLGNLSYSVEKSDVENFFKDAGDVVDVRFALDPEGIFKGFGHVDFATAEAATKALELNGEDLLGRQIRLDRAKEKGAYTPSSGQDRNSFQKGGRTPGQTIFVRGFDSSGGENKIKSELEKYFGSCGDISRVAVPVDRDTNEVKGMAYLDFNDSESFNKALELNGTKLGNSYLTVEEARSRDSAGGSRGGSRDSGGRFGRGGRRGGRDGGGRFGNGGGGRFGSGGGRFGSGGGRFGGGRGRVTPGKPSMATPGTGKKTTFD